nr:hypothetical protein [Eubacterium sp.]
MRTSKRLLKILFFIALFFVFNGVLTFLITPFCTSSSQMWDLYRAKDDEQLDMIYIGNSTCLEDVDPSVVDAYTGLKSYNMGTNSQTYMCSEEAVRVAIEDHDISHVVFVFDEYYLSTGAERNARAEASFIHAENKGTDIAGRLARNLSYMFDP